MEELEVVIIGAGPTGLVLGIELARRGIKFKIFDKLPVPQNLSKALLIQARTLEIFQEYEIIDDIFKEAIALKGTRLHLGEKHLDVDFVQLESKFPYGVILPQTETETILRKKLESLNGFVEWNKEFSFLKQNNEGVEVHFKDGSIIHTKYLVAADGAHSSIRHDLNIEFEGKELESTFALGDVIFENDELKDRIEGFMISKFLILFPLPDNRYKVVIREENISKDKVLTKEELQILLKECQCPYTIKEALWLSYFHINFRIINKYRINNVFLAGDAAHIHSPAGGLGMNTGIQDAYNLGWKLAFVLRKLIDKKILDTYQEERVPVAKEVLKKTEKLTDVMTAKGVLAFLRNHIIPFIIPFNYIKRRLLNNMAQLTINYKKGSLSKGLLGGQKINDDDLFIVGKPKNHLFELTKSTKFVLLIHTNNNQELFNKALAIKTEVLSHFSKQIDVYMVEGSIKEDLILIRPDQYVAMSCSLNNSKELICYLNELFIKNS